VRADELEELVWGQVRRLLEKPDLVRAEIDRRLQALRTEHPAARRRETLERDLVRADAAITRLIEAYQEQLISLDELRARMPALRKRQATLRAQLDALAAELHDAETYLRLAETLEGFLARLGDGLDQLTIEERQRILRLVVREVLIGGKDDTITVRHSIPTPNAGPNGTGCPLRGSRQTRSLRRARWRGGQGAMLAHDPGGEEPTDQLQDALVGHPAAHLLHHQTVMDRPEAVLDVSLDHPLVTTGGVDEEPHLLNGVLCSAPGPEPIRGRAEVRL
jgi:site-specific DNA recombinase